MKKTVYLTGGTGFIGQHFARAWLNKSSDHHIIVQTRTPERFNSVQSVSSEQQTCRYVASLAELPKDIENYTLVNLAGAPIADCPWSNKRKALLLRSRVEFTDALFQNALHVGMPLRVVNASAIGFYGMGDQECDEASPSGGGFAAELCRQWERAASQFDSFAPLLRVRIGVVLGLGGGALNKLLPLYRLGLGGPIGKGEQWFSWIHLQDMVNILIEAVEQPDWSGVVNAVAPSPVKQIDFALALAKALHRPAFLRTPATVLRLIYGEMAEELLLSGQRVSPKVMLDRGFTYSFPEIELALNDIVLALNARR